MHLRVLRPSPALAVGFVALFVALAGTGYAASNGGHSNKHGDAKQDKKLIKHMAGGLSVKHAKTANTAKSAKTANFATTAGFANNAGNANNATHANNATSATNAANANNANTVGGQSASAFEPANKIVTGGGEKFLSMGQTNVQIAKVGHFTFTASCTTVGGQPQAEFDVVADTTADLDGTGPAAAGTVTDIHQNGDSIDTLPAGTFDQVGSASDSTEIAADGQQVDVFYNDGTNWPAGNGSAAHDCFAGVTGIQA